MAFAHAVAGGQVIVVTLLTESHNVLLENMRDYDFFDARLVGKRIHYMSLMTPLQEDGLTAALDMLRREVIKAKATLVVIDGTAIDDNVGLSNFDLQRFAQRIDTQSAFLAVPPCYSPAPATTAYIPCGHGSMASSC
jgi:circadian clock protein KaiC